MCRKPYSYVSGGVNVCECVREIDARRRPFFVIYDLFVAFFALVTCIFMCFTKGLSVPSNDWWRVNLWPHTIDGTTSLAPTVKEIYLKITEIASKLHILTPHSYTVKYVGAEELDERSLIHVRLQNDHKLDIWDVSHSGVTHMWTVCFFCTDMNLL